MPTSAKVQFKLAELQQRALDSIDERIADAEAELQDLTSQDSVEMKRAEWRQQQEQRLSTLFADLSTLSNEQLSRFRIEPLPEPDDRDLRHAARKLADLRADRSRIIAKSASLVPNDDGNLSLTTTQLSEFFGL